MDHTVAVDSNMLTYAHDATSLAFHPDSDPDRKLAAEKVALVRTLFYWQGTLRLLPMVMEEYQRIRNSARRDSHDIFGMILFDEIEELDSHTVEAATEDYFQFHHGRDDCRLVAEAQVSRTEVLLTYDNDLRRNLGSRARGVRLMTAVEFWTELRLPRGSCAHLLPKPGNPLLEEDWWRW